MDDNKLVRMMEKSMSIKSLRDLARSKESGNVVLLIDVSGSMGAYMRNGKRRIDGLREAVAGIQAKRSTTMIAFGLEMHRRDVETGERSNSGEVAFVSSVPDAQGMTPLAEAIEFAGQHGFGRLVVISDGSPNPPHSRVTDAAKAFGGQIDVLFVGDPGDPGSAFLDGLAQLTGGQRFEGDLSDVKEITGAIIGLLNGDVLEQDDEDDDDEDDDENGDDDDDGDDEDEDAEDAEEID